MNIRTLGIDLAKNVFRVHGVDSRGKTVVQRELRRRQLLSFKLGFNPAWWGWKRAAARTTGRAR